MLQGMYQAVTQLPGGPQNDEAPVRGRHRAVPQEDLALARCGREQVRRRQHEQVPVRELDGSVAPVGVRQGGELQDVRELLPDEQLAGFAAQKVVVHTHHSHAVGFHELPDLQRHRLQVRDHDLIDRSGWPVALRHGSLRLLYTEGQRENGWAEHRSDGFRVPGRLHSLEEEPAECDSVPLWCSRSSRGTSTSTGNSSKRFTPDCRLAPEESRFDNSN
mmetsp:Transcript_43914/g.88546  ORF Transcript_43914/g.88546 Transcript_43914/m.88546 type:complete len:218 (-) Transcript_43914:13-666(-)